MSAISTIMFVLRRFDSWRDLEIKNPKLYRVMLAESSEIAYNEMQEIKAMEDYLDRERDARADQTEDDWSIWDYINQVIDERNEAYQQQIDEDIQREEQKTRRQRRISKRLYKRRLLSQAKNRLGWEIHDNRLFDDDRRALADWDLGRSYTNGYELIPLSEAAFQGTSLWQIESELTISRHERWDMESRQEASGKYNHKRNAKRDMSERVNDWLAGDLPDRVERVVEPAIAKQQAENDRKQYTEKYRRIEELNSLLRK